MNKKAQLAFIEMKFAIMGFILGIALALLFIFLANKTSIIPFKLGFLC